MFNNNSIIIIGNHEILLIQFWNFMILVLIPLKNVINTIIFNTIIVLFLRIKYLKIKLIYHHLDNKYFFDLINTILFL